MSLTDGFLLMGLPVPPSSNNQYVSFMRGGKVVHAPSKELKAFVRSMSDWALISAPSVSRTRAKVREWIGAGMVLDVRMYVGFKSSRLVVKDGSAAKRIDSGNRMKAMHDCLAEILGVDDSVFWSVTSEKVETTEGKDECVTVTIKPMFRRTLTQVNSSLASPASRDTSASVSRSATS